MQDKSEKPLLDEAAQIFLRLQQSPKDPTLVAQRDAFLARGEAEQAAYRKIAAGWKIAGPERKSRPLILVPFLAATALSIYAFAEPLKVIALADFSTGMKAEPAELTSGDRVHLDAGTAIIENSDVSERRVELMRGSAFFDVKDDTRPFVLSIAPLEVAVVGTAFEAARIGEAVRVTVQEGEVTVSRDNTVWLLGAGDRLLWSQDTGVTIAPLDPDMIAQWRRDQLVADNMAFTDIADIIDRRLAGRVIVIGSDLQNARLSGNFDLSKPRAALRILAATEGSRVVSVGPLGSVIYGGENIP